MIITRHLGGGVHVRRITKLHQQELINNLSGGDRIFCGVWLRCGIFADE